MPGERAHSEDYLGASRNYWWNADFVKLMAHRWRLNLAHAVLDVGSGLGHWGRTLLPHLPSGGIIHGVDREARWVSESAERAARDGLSDRFHYLLGSAEELPFADETFERKHSARVTIPLEICSRGISANAGFVKSRFTSQTRQRL